MQVSSTVNCSWLWNFSDASNARYKITSTNQSARSIPLTFVMMSLTLGSRRVYRRRRLASKCLNLVPWLAECDMALRKAVLFSRCSQACKRFGRETNSTLLLSRRRKAILLAAASRTSCCCAEWMSSTELEWHWIREISLFLVTVLVVARFFWNELEASVARKHRKD